MPSVSRETPPPPEVAHHVFGASLPLAIRYAELLADAGVVRGLIGPRERPRLWDRHLLNCALLAEGIGADSSVADIGSGAGLPGLVLALCRPDLRLTLVEPQRGDHLGQELRTPLQRRTEFLAEVVAALGLRQVEVVRARAEELHGKRDFTSVVSRAVAPLPRLLTWCLPLVEPGGQMLAIKGAGAERELREAAGALRRARAGTAQVVRFGVGVVDPPTTAVRVAAPGRPG